MFHVLNTWLAILCGALSCISANSYVPRAVGHWDSFVALTVLMVQLVNSEQNVVHGLILWRIVY